LKKQQQKTVRMTVREFASSIGLKKTGLDYLGSTVLMKLLCKKGIARKVGKVSLTRMGRPSELFEVPVEITLTNRRRRSKVA
jgi:hypothetical protein